MAKEKQNLSIGEMAKLNNTTVPTLRLYDELGLLNPIYIDESSHYRYYDIKQNARFDMIQYMKELGMELKEIKEVLDAEDLELIEAILIRKKEQNLKEIKHLQIKQDAINRTIDSIDRYRKSPPKGTLTLEYIPERRIYSMECDVNFYDHDIDTYEILLKKLKEQLLSNNIPQVYYFNAGTILKKEDFLDQNFVSNQIFVFADTSFPLIDETRTIESGMYACIYLDDFNQEQDYAKRLFNYCNENKYQICGDYLCEVLTEFNVFGKEQRSMFLRLQVPVRFKK